jgi:hypothetical protein
MLTCVSVLCIDLSGATREVEKGDKKDQQIHAIIREAPAAPAELAADILLQLVEKGLVQDRKLRVELLTRSFELAGSAHFRLRLTAIGTGESRQSDTDTGMIDSALKARLDTMSLRLRSVQQLLPLDAHAALKMFTELAVVNIPILSCRDALGYSLDDYYKTVGLLYNSSAFTEQERRREFLSARLLQIQSSFALEPASRMLCDLHLKRNELREAAGLYAHVLNELQTDDRSFTATTTPVLLESVLALAEQLKTQQTSAVSLISALRNYLQRQFRYPRCADTVMAADAALQRSIVEQLNTHIKTSSPELVTIPSISTDDMRPRALDDSAKVYIFWNNTRTRGFLEECRSLVLGADEESRRDKQMSETTWLEKANSFLSRLEHAEIDAEPGNAGFHEKCSLYETLLRVAPSREVRSRLFGEYNAFLRNSQVETDSPPEWALHVTRLLAIRGGEEKSDSYAQQVIQQGDAAMHVMAELALLASAK